LMGIHEEAGTPCDPALELYPLRHHLGDELMGADQQTGMFHNHKPKSIGRDPTTLSL
jgi:hypothetical protein